MKRILVLALFLSPHVSQGISFDCHKSTTDTEKTICNDKSGRLSKLDDQLSLLYDHATKSIKNSGTIRTSQREWLNKIRDKCKNADCIEAAYKNRIRELKLIVSNSPMSEMAALELVQSYSRDDSVCNEAASMLSEDIACRPFDAIRCDGVDPWSVNIRGNRIRVFEEISVNQYDYTRVFRSTVKSLRSNAVVYVLDHQGDRRPLLMQTWIVDAAELDKVLSLSPGPWPYAKWVKMKPWPPKKTHAVEFISMLRRGELLTQVWSPVIEIRGEPYIVERECSGLWGYGGYYACNKVIKLTIKKLAKDKKTVPYCQFKKPRN